MNYNIKKKFQIYNALFLNLSYEGANDFANLIPILGAITKQNLERGEDPIMVFNDFFDDYKEMIGVDKLDFMFKVIQYVERQIVLFDSVEDSISPYDLEDQDSILIDTMVSKCQSDTEVNDLLKSLNEFAVRIVLTAHPTQFYRAPVLDIIAKLRKGVRGSKVEEIDRLLHQLGLTSLVNTTSPTPIEEAKNIIHFCRYEYYNAIGDFIYALEQKYPNFDNVDLVKIGFWPCGDRDGNAFVTHNVTREVVDTLRMTLVKCYYNDVKALRSKLTFKGLEAPLEKLQDKLYKAMFDPSEILDHKWMLNSLDEVRSILVDKYESLYLEDLDKLVVKIKVFKTHFASLDIRQDHSVHVDCIQQILKSNGLIQNSIKELDESSLIKILTEDFLEIPDASELEGLVKDTIQNIEQLPTLQKYNGEQGCHRYIISNSEDIYSVLFVFGLFRWIHKSEAMSFDIIPLFETMVGMEVSESVMDQLYKLKPYKLHLESREAKQTVMLGFSDGTKDGGYLKANWSIYKCKEVLSKVSRLNNISAIFFDGRGGPPARGGGKTFNFYAARSKEIANNDIQLTIQGQTITSTYGTSEKFVFNAEQMVSSGLTSLKSDGRMEISISQRSLLEELSELSYKKYISLKEHPKFLPYLENMTTLRFYSKTKVGSRPGKRSKTAKLTLGDLRAISYVGSWSQLKQNIPGYYGVGTAISQLTDAGRMEEMQNLYQEVPLFKTLIDNSMMSLTKCFFELTSYMSKNPEYGPFWNMLYDEYTLSKNMILELTQMSELMETEQRSKQSIQIRNEIVRPLLLIQHYALQMINSGADPENLEIYEKLVVRSLYGNINASRNSA